MRLNTRIKIAQHIPTPKLCCGLRPYVFRCVYNAVCNMTLSQHYTCHKGKICTQVQQRVWIMYRHWNVFSPRSFNVMSFCQSFASLLHLMTKEQELWNEIYKRYIFSMLNSRHVINWETNREKQLKVIIMSDLKPKSLLQIFSFFAVRAQTSNKITTEKLLPFQSFCNLNSNWIFFYFQKSDFW